MSTSLFNISLDYLKLIQEIENNEGEITEDIDSKLTINREELEKKCKDYCHLIKMIDGDISIADDEIKRLQALKKVKQNLIKTLKKRLIDATNLFGDDGKSGNKILSFDILKLSTRLTPVVNVNEEDFINDAITCVDTDFKDYYSAYNYNVVFTVDWETYHKLKESTDIPFEMTPKINKDIIGSVIDSGIEVPNAIKAKSESIIIK